LHKGKAPYSRLYGDGSVPLMTKLWIISLAKYVLSAIYVIGYA